MVDLVALNDGPYRVVPSLGVFTFDLSPVRSYLGATKPLTQHHMRKATEERLYVVIVIPAKNGQLRPTNREGCPSGIRVIADLREITAP